MSGRAVAEFTTARATLRLVVGGWRFWYFYPERIYPYPVYVPPATVEQQPPPVPVRLPPPQNWYFYDNPQGCYPYGA